MFKILKIYFFKKLFVFNMKIIKYQFFLAWKTQDQKK